MTARPTIAAALCWYDEPAESLERAFWNVLDDMASESKITLPRLIERVHDGCLVANDKNIASCLRVICLKYLNVYSSCAPAARAELTRVA